MEGEFHILTFSGDINQAEFQKNFSQAYKLLGDLTGIMVLFNLSDIPHINSTFIGYTIELFSKIDQNKGKLVVVGNPAIEDIFFLVGFKDIISIVNDKEAALKLLKEFADTRE